MDSDSTQPKAKANSSNIRRCLICASDTRTSHIGVDACRACAIFYRRAKEKGKRYVCRSGTGKCDIDRAEGFTCKHCRFEKFHALLKGSVEVPSSNWSIMKKSENTIVTIIPDLRKTSPEICTLDSPAPSVQLFKEESPPKQEPPLSSPFSYMDTTSTVSSHITQNPPPINVQSLPGSSSDSSFTYIIPSVSLNVGYRHPIGSVERITINRIRQSYTLLSLVRRTSELSTRKVPIHPLVISDGEVPLIPSTYRMANLSTRILVTSLFDFAASAFDEFGSLDKNDKWLLIKHFYDNFSILESTYRMNLLFPDKTGMCFCGFTAYIDINSIKGFFVDSPNAGNEEEAERLMTKLFRDGGQKEGKMIREALKRLNPSEEEFIALLGLTFWNIESTPAGDHLLRLSEKYKKNILHELHILYKDEQNQGEYAGRLGELFFLLMTFQTCVSKNPENFEIFRLLDVISDDSLVYQMMKQ